MKTIIVSPLERRVVSMLELKTNGQLRPFGGEPLPLVYRESQSFAVKIHQPISRPSVEAGETLVLKK